MYSTAKLDPEDAADGAGIERTEGTLQQSPYATVDLRPARWWQNRRMIGWLVALGVACVALAIVAVFLVSRPDGSQVASATIPAVAAPGTGAATAGREQGAPILPAPAATTGQPAKQPAATVRAAAPASPTAAVVLLTTSARAAALPSATVSPSATATIAGTSISGTAAPDPLAAVRTQYAAALASQDATAAKAALASLAGFGNDPAANALSSEIQYGVEYLEGNIYLNSGNLKKWDLQAAAGTPLVNSIDLAVSNDAVYVLDSGTLYRAPLAALPGHGGALKLTAVITPSQNIGGYPVKEIGAIDAADSGARVWALDKAGDLYASDTGADAWRLERTLVSNETDPDPLMLNITTYSGTVYAIDPAQNQVWRHPATKGLRYFPQRMPWQLRPGDADLTGGMDLGIDGSVYVLDRRGYVSRFDGVPVNEFMLNAAKSSAVSGLGERPVAGVSMALGPDPYLFVADPATPGDLGGRRVVVLNRENGEVKGWLAAPDNPAFDALHAVAYRDGTLYMVAGPSLYAFDAAGWLAGTSPISGTVPAWAPRVDTKGLSLEKLAPNSPLVPEIVASRHFTVPIKGMSLPDRAAAYPGARRAYRYGVHEGLDLYAQDIGAELKVGTPVYAVAGGAVIRADTDYKEMTPAENQAMLADAHDKHNTPLDTLNRLGGRQVWIDHGEGLGTRYLHLSGIAPGIEAGKQVKAGDLLGYVGLSGTADGLQGLDYLAHLHFEIRVGANGGHFLGQWLSTEDVRRAYELILGVPVKPLEVGPVKTGNNG